MSTAVTFVSPIWPANLTAMRIKSGKAVFTAIGREKCCPRCNEYWPADSQFYHTNPSSTDGLQYWCKACYAEWQQAKQLKKQELSCIH